MAALNHRLGRRLALCVGVVVVWSAFSAGPAFAQFVQQGAKLVGSGAVYDANQGHAVSISADGNTAIVGGYNEFAGVGAARIWTRSGGVWTAGQRLLGTPQTGASAQGWSVAISSDGTTAIVGGHTDNNYIGAAWVWGLSGGTWIQQAKLVGGDAVGTGFQGASVALSADGNTAIVGGSIDNNGVGAAWVWTRSGSAWTQQGAKLVGTGGVLQQSQGYAVSLSADGDTAIITGAFDNNSTGAAWVWTRSLGVWTQQGPKLVGSGAVGAAFQGFSVSLAADGNTALVGGWEDNSNAGAVWVWTRSGSVWTQQGPKLVGSGAVGSAQQGYSVALSADSDTAIVGGRYDNFGCGAAWTWTRSAGVWTQQGPKLIGSGAVGCAGQGWDVALSSDGSIAMVGGILDNSNTGATWVWTRSGGTWTQQGPKLAVAYAFQGTSVSLSADGNTAIAGGPLDTASAGAVWIWTRTGGVWTQGPKLVGSGAVGQTGQGASVSISADGNTALIGGPGDNGGAGAAWVWTRSGSVWTQQGSKLVGTGAVGAAEQGASVSLSSDGNTAIVGGPRDNNFAGAAWVWRRTGGVWTQQGTKLVGSGAAGAAQQGQAVSLSADGNTAISGGQRDNNSAGAVWVWTRSGGLWTQQGAKLVAASCNSYLGRSVALSGDGKTAIAGAPAGGGGVDATCVWTGTGGIWTQQGGALVGSGALGFAGQGQSVSLSDNGDTAIVGGMFDDAGAGAAWVWKRSGGVWTQLGSKLVGSGAVGKAREGYSVALSADASTAIVGGPLDDVSTGAAWVFGALPEAFTKTAPANGATGQSASLTLSWGPSIYATSYEYCIDTSNNSACDASWISTGANTAAGLSGLAPGTTHYWHVRGVNTSGTTYADGAATAYWSFTTMPLPPGAFGKSTPTAGATGQPASPTLSWSTSNGAASYEYCYDTTNNSACDTAWVPVGSVTTAALNGLSANTVYFWHVRAVNGGGTTYADASATAFWGFRTGTPAPAFGQVDTPAQNSAGVQGAIGVTGWALDDTGVSTVQIFRNCLAFEPANCQTVLGNNVVYIGDAAFLAGARPDVAAAFPTYPQNTRAGWGYLMLTPMLPHVPNSQAFGGQGPLTLYVVATDTPGNKTLLGRTFVSGDPGFNTPTSFSMTNDTIAKPFGAIDTPGQGQTISGIFNNFGWAVTPDTNTVADGTDILIPTNGSTMTVFIDGLPVSLVAYNQCRGDVGNPPPGGVYCNDDVANIFGNPTPQTPMTTRTSNPTKFRNLDAARGVIGAYTFDTTSLSDGLHTIAWSVSDSAGRNEGIGSRFFNVLNGAPDAQLEDALRSAPAQVLGLGASLDRHAPGTDGVWGRTGFDLATSWTRMHAKDDRTFAVRLPELGRLELWLGSPVDAGYLVADDTLHPLPVGASLVGAQFGWMPPAGYMGAYTLAFIRGEERVTVTVTIVPRPRVVDGRAQIRMQLSASVEGLALSERSARIERGAHILRVEGWAFDPQAAMEAGIGAVHVWARKVHGESVSLGAAVLDQARPDVARAVSGAPGHAGFSLTTSLAPGTYEVTAYAWNERTSRWEDARSVQVVVR